LTLNWHEWNSCPSRLFSVRGFSFWEMASYADEPKFGSRWMFRLIPCPSEKAL
jgi:hypothetical protein